MKTINRYETRPSIPLNEIWLRPNSYNQHLENIRAALIKLSDGFIAPAKTYLDRHLHFISRDGRFVTVIVPWPEHTNYCLNFGDKEKLAYTVNKDKMSILFARFLPTSFTLVRYKDWNSFDFNIFDIEDSKRLLGTYFFMKRKYIETMRENPYEFDGLFPIKDRKNPQTVFDFDAVTPPDARFGMESA